MDTESFEQIVSAVRRLVRDVVVPREQEIEDTDAIPDDLRAAAAEMGLFGYALPTEYGGLGVTMSEDVRLAFELGYTAPAFRSLFGTNNGIAGQMIAKFADPDLRALFLPPMAEGKLIASFALTESEAGSDPSGLRTTARRDGAHWVLDGTKRFITNAPHAGIFTLMARTDPNNKGAGGVTAFIVEANSPGITIGKPDKKMGQRGAHTADVIFDNVKVPAANIIGGKEGQGFKTAMKVLDRGRLHIAAMCVGAAERLIHESVSYARDRKQFGQPIA